MNCKLNLENSFDIYFLFILFCQLPEIDKGHRRDLASRSGFEAAENIFTKRVTDKIDRTCLHYNMDIDFAEIIRRFARLHPRRMELANIFSD